MRTQNYRQDASRHALAVATFHEQMADFARRERLVRLREARHLSQEDAAHGVGVTTKSLRAWEKGGAIRWHNAQKLAKFYGVEPESIVQHESTKGSGDAPDLMAFLENDTSQLDRIEAKLDDLLTQLAAKELPSGFDQAAFQAGAQPAPSDAGPQRQPAKRAAS